MGKAGYLKVETAHNGLVCVLAVTGELDLVTVPNLAESAAAALKIPAERFVLDLSRLSFTDCAGVRALAAITRAVPAGCPVIVRSVSPALRRVLNLMGVNLESRVMVPGEPGRLAGAGVAADPLLDPARHGGEPHAGRDPGRDRSQGG